MTMRDIHAAAGEASIAAYHEFLQRYSKQKRVVYGFVEGKEDPSFYRGFIEAQLPSGWEVELWPAGNRDRVFEIYKGIDWARLPKQRICFFVDRDLSDLIPEHLLQDLNIYVTDGYSIENDIATRAVCRRILSEIWGLDGATHSDLDGVCELFERELEVFCLAVLPIMAWILRWRMTGKRACLNDIMMRDLFSVKSGNVHASPSPKGKSDPIEYIHAQCNIPFDGSISTEELESKLKARGVRACTRGKYLLWFLVAFCESVRSAAAILCPSCAKVSPKRVVISAANCVVVIGNRARPPASLVEFIATTYRSFVAAASMTEPVRRIPSGAPG